MEQDIKLSYIATLHQVRVSFSSALPKELRKPGRDLFKRAKTRLEDDMQKGFIEAFVIYEDIFLKLWEFLRDQDDPPDELVTFVLAQGYRLPKEILLRTQMEKVWLLTYTGSSENLAKFSWPRFRAYCLKTMNADHILSPGLLARLWEVYIRILFQEKIQDFVLQPLALDEEGPALKTSFDKTNGCVYLWIRDAKLLREPGFKKILQFVKLQSEKWKTQYPFLHFWQNELGPLKESQVGMESFGLGLPLIIPIARKLKDQTPLKEKRPILSQTDTLKSPLSSVRAAEPISKKADRFLQIEISEDRLEAKIAWADDAALQAAQLDTQPDWFKKKWEEQGIRYGYESYLDKILSCLSLGQSIKGQVIARGLAAKAGEQTYLHPLYLEKSIDDAAAQVDLRLAQNKRVVELGDVIAELRFRDGKAGIDVCGKALHAVASQASLAIELGKGVERREDGRFYALLRGVPKLDRFRISCGNVLVHEGDVNLKTGDISFDGSVEIKGSIDSGARVFARDDLIVRGSIGRARVRCGGDLTVGKGIVSSREGFIHCGGNLWASFIENSRVLVDGNLEVEQSLINSDCKVAGDIKLIHATKGLVGGGYVVAGQTLITAQLGFQDGEKTTCRIGSDWKLEHRWSLLKGRASKLKKFLQERQYEIEELQKKKGLGPDRLAKAQARLLKAKALLARIEEMMESLRNRIRWNEDSYLVIRGTLDANCELMLGGRMIPVAKSLKEVLVTAVRYRDQYVNSLDYLEVFKKQRPNLKEAG